METATSDQLPASTHASSTCTPEDSTPATSAAANVSTGESLLDISYLKEFKTNFHFQQQQVRPPTQPPVGPRPENSEVLYNVEHLFEEDGKMVRKMPIKVGDETIWVETVNNQQNDKEMGENSIMLPLNEGPNDFAGQPPQAPPGQQHPPHHPAHHTQPHQPQQPPPQQPQQQQQQQHPIANAEDDFEPPQQKIIPHTTNRKAR